MVLAGDFKPNEWSQWRGPNRDGVSLEKGLLKSWPEEGPALVWKAENLGGGYSTPSFADGKVFGMSYRDEDEVVWALDVQSGKEIWNTRIAHAARVDRGQGSRSTPTIDGNLLFALGVSGELVCLNSDTGEEIWHRSLEKEFGGRRPSWGYSESVLVDGDQLACTPGGAQGAVIALNKNTGEIIWQSQEFTDSSAYASLVVANFGDIRQYVQMTHTNVAGIRATDGTLLWKYERNGPTAAVPTPIISNDLVYATSGYGAGCHMIQIVKHGTELKPQEIYANDVMTNHHGGVVLIGEHIYGFSDSKGWVCQNLKTGEMIWNDRRTLGKGAITYADGLLFLRSERGTVALIQAVPDGYKETGRFEQPDRSSHPAWPHPVIVHGRLYLRDQDMLLCYDVKESRSGAAAAATNK
jgi:outer membrane protein assembly factor BamB